MSERTDMTMLKGGQAISSGDLEFVGSKINGFVHAANVALPQGEGKFPLEDPLVAEALLGAYFSEVLKGQKPDTFESRYGACVLELLQVPTNRDRLILQKFGIRDPATSVDVLTVVARRVVLHIFQNAKEVPHKKVPPVTSVQETTELLRRKPVRVSPQKQSTLPVMEALDEESSGTDWQNRAACRDSIARGNDLWGDEDAAQETLAEAKRICATCDVAAACLKFALEQDIKHGIWGGLMPKERRKITARQPRR